MPEVINIEMINVNLYEHKLDITRDGVTVCCALIAFSQSSLWLKWIQTVEKYQNQGVGSFVLDYIADVSVAQQLDLEIKVVDEEVLAFYFKWFSRRADPENVNQDAVKEKFNSFCDGNDSPQLVLSCDDISWRASEEHLSRLGF